MAGYYEPDWGTAYYRSNDPIKNLRIKVTLKRVSAAAGNDDTSQPSTSEGVSEEGGVELRTLKHSKGRSRDYEERVIQWQEKIFCQREMELYSNEANCDSVMARKYHNDVTSLPARKRQRNMIFSFVDHDDFSHQREGEQMMTDYGGEPSTLASNMAQVRCRRMAGRQLREKEQGSIPKTLIVDENPNQDSKLKNHLEAPPIQVMYIMADLGSSDSVGDESDEYILCTFKIDANGVLSVRPDFTNGRKPYTIETLRTREGFDYTIENISKDMSRQEYDKEMKMYREMYTRHSEFVQSCVGFDFELPPEDSLRYIIFGEVVSAENFEKDNLYVQLFADLPKNWTAERSQQLSWVTQCCTTKTENEVETAYFCYPFHCELIYKRSLTTTNTEHLDRLLPFPRLMLEVGALDSWYRHFNEGYSYIQLPAKPGIHIEKAHCWRPVGNSITDNLRRFFTGGTVDIEDPTYAAVPSTFDGSCLSKFGFKTQSTGTVTVRLNVVLQSRSFIEKRTNKHSLGALLDNLGITAMQANITSVLEAFKRARMKMMHAREAATQELLREVKPIDKTELLGL